MRTCSPHEIYNLLHNTPDPASPALQLLDVREPWEYETVHIEGSTLIPLGQLAQQYEKLDKSIPIAVICHHGIRSAHACYFLEKSGFETINIRGGIDLWARELDASMPLY
ncbi:MAG: rhodanese-like domain-containing protein [Thiolinea sp.]